MIYKLKISKNFQSCNPSSIILHFIYTQPLKRKRSAVARSEAAGADVCRLAAPGVARGDHKFRHSQVLRKNPG